MIVPGSKLPEFKTVACVSIEKGKEFADVSSTSYPGKWLVIYTYPKDFTFVCPTEIVEFDKKLGAFADRDAVVLGGSTDNEHSHLAGPKGHGYLEGVKPPVVFFGAAVMGGLGISHPAAGVALRATLIVDP